MVLGNRLRGHEAARQAETERTAAFYEVRKRRVKSAKPPKQGPPKNATSSARGRRGGYDNLAKGMSAAEGRRCPGAEQVGGV